MLGKWKLLGVVLGLPKHLLDAMRGDPQECLVSMLDLWLKRADPAPTWPAVIEAVELLEDETLARELRTKFCAH